MLQLHSQCLIVIIMPKCCFLALQKLQEKLVSLDLKGIKQATVRKCALWALTEVDVPNSASASMIDHKRDLRLRHIVIV